MYSIRYSPEAVNDLRDTLEYISLDLASPEAARNTVKKIRKNILILQDNPKAGKRLDNYISVKTDYRMLICENYLAFYRIEEKHINIVRILYGRRNWIKILFGSAAEYLNAMEDTE